MNKTALKALVGLIVLFGLAIPLYALSKEGDAGSSSAAVPADEQNAKELFATNCGSCHTLAKAGTDGSVGPNLDMRLAAQGPATDEGQIEATESRVHTAIQNGIEGAMPAGILDGSQADEVSAFVATVAGQ